MYAGNPLWAWGLAAAAAAGLFLSLQLTKQVALRALRRRLRVEDPGVADLLSRLLRRTWLVFAVISLHAGSLVLELPRAWRDILEGAAVTALIVQLGLWASGWISWWIDRTTRQRLTADPAAAMSATVIGYVGRIALWAAIVLLVLDNLGVQVTALIAGLGIGGIAVALAVQSILKDLFASLSIVMDRPFEVGDFIAVGDVAGTVERVGLKTTRVRSLQGEQVILPNGNLLESRIRNFKRMD
jgi:small-conductance mechanosensitive channel